MRQLQSLLLQFFDIFCHIFPVSKNKVFFLSFAGQYNDNPKYISEKLHEMFPNMEQYWCISPKSKQNDIPGYIHKLTYGSFYSIFIKNRCGVVITNGAGYYLVNCERKLLFKFKKHLKNRKQFDLATWHGFPIKHIGAQIPQEGHWSLESSFSTSDMMLSGYKREKELLEMAFINLMPVRLLGTPRTDIFFNDTEERKTAVKKKLGLPEKKVIIYAPTYRYSTKDSGIEQLNMINLEVLLSELGKRFGGEWIFVMRVHNLVLMEIKKSGLLDKYQGQLFDGNQFDDMNEYLYASDILLTDYSSCIYDVALTSKPCFMFAHDRKYYEEHERGLYTQLSDFPYPFSTSFEELISDIQGFDSHSFETKRQSFLRQIGNINDGKASQRVLEYLRDNHYLG